MTADMTAEDIDTRIIDKLSGYATKTYADERDALNATPGYVDAGDATRLKLASKDVAGGIVGLDAFGRANRNRIDANDTQRFPKGLWTPASYGSPLTATNAEKTLFTMDVTDPGYAYKLLVSGSLDGLSALDGVAPIIRVRAGTADGPIIASGIGSYESYDYMGVDNFMRTATTLGDGWTNSANGRTNGSAATFGANSDFRRLGDDAVTPTNYQEITWKNASACQGGTGPVPYNYILGRMSDDGKDWAGFILAASTAYCSYSVNGTAANFTSVACANDANAVFRARIGTEAGERQFQLLRNDTVVLTYTDTAAASPMGPTRRGWGFGYRSGVNFFTPTYPAALDYITINDAIPGQDTASYAPVVVLPTSMASQAVRTGPVKLYITVIRTGSLGAVSAGYDFHDSLTALAVPA